MVAFFSFFLSFLSISTHTERTICGKFSPHKTRIGTGMSARLSVFGVMRSGGVGVKDKSWDRGEAEEPVP